MESRGANRYTFLIMLFINSYSIGNPFQSSTSQSTVS
jgi:hypothetical protein